LLLRQGSLYRAVGVLCLLAEGPRLQRQPIDFLVKEGLEVHSGSQVFAGLVEERAQASGDLGSGAACLLKIRPRRRVEADELGVSHPEHARWLLRRTAFA